MVEKIGLAATLDMAGWTSNVNQYKQDVEGMGSSTEKSATQMQALGTSLTKVGGSLTNVGKDLTMGVTAPLVGIGVAAAKMAGDFEQQMNILAVSARSSGTALEDLSKAALSVGADTELVGITAAQSADAMTSLYKAGFDTAEIFGGAGGLNSYLNENASLTGALRSSIDLAAASELDLAQATDVTIIAMKTFGLGSEEASRVANSFVRTADASVTSVGDLAAAMTNIGPTAAAFGMSLETTNTALAILSSRGISGAEAGTALKSMLTNMMRTTPDVTAAWQQLGITMYDAEGRMRAMPDILAELSDALTVGNVLTSERAVLTEKEIEQLAKLEQKRADLAAKDLAIRDGTLMTNATLKEREAELKKVDKALEMTVFEMEQLKAKEGETITVMTPVTEEFRNQTVQTLAGTYGMKAMNTLLAEGAVGWTSMETAISAAASVEESAGARTTGFNAALEQLIGALETIAITAGGPIITALTNLLQGPISGLLDKISNLNPVVWDWALKIGLVVAAVGPLLLVLGSLLTTIGSVITIVTTLGPLFATVGAAIGAIAAPVLLIGGAIALLAAAWVNDWGGIATFMTGFWNNTLKPIIDQIIVWFQTNIPAAIQALAGFWTGTLLPAIQAVGDFITGTLVPVLQTIWDWLSTNIPAAIQAVSGFWTGTLLPAIQAVADFFTGTLFPLLAAIADVYFAAWDLALTAAAGLWQNVLLPALIAVGTYLAGPLISAFTTISAFITDTLVPALTALFSWLGEKLQPVIEAVATWFRDTFVPAVADVADKLNTGLNPALEWLHDKLLEPLKTALGTLGEKLQAVTTWFGNLADKISGLKDKLPSWLTPGSPTPLEEGLVGIGEAMLGVVEQFVNFGASLKGVNLDNLQRFGLAVRDIAKDLKDLASAFHQMNKVEKTEGGLPSLELWANALKESIIRFSRAITEAAKEVKTSTINNARELAKKIEEIFELLRTLGSVLNDLNAIETIPDMGPFGAALKQAITTTASAILEASQQLGDKALQAAASMAEDAKEIISLIGPAVSALAAMADMKEVTDLRAKSGKLEEAINIFVYTINRVAQFWSSVALDAAATFAETAQTILGLIGPGIQALANFVNFPEVEDLRGKSGKLEEALNIFVYTIQRAANFWKDVALGSAASFSEDAQKIIALIEPAVQSVAAMLLMPETEGLRDKGASFEAALNTLVYYIQRAANFWKDVALASVAEFSQTVQQIVGIVEPAINALGAIAEYSTAQGLEGKFAAFEADVKALVQRIQNISLDVGVISEEAIAFANAVTQIVGFIKPAIDALKELAEYATSKKLPAAMDAFESDVTALVARIRIIYANIGDISDEALQFSQDVQQLVSFIKPAIDAITALGDYAAKAGLAKALAAFEADIKAVVQKLAQIATDIGGPDGVGKAEEFSRHAETIRDAIETGLGTLASLESGGGQSAAAALGSFARAAEQAMRDAVAAIQKGATDIARILGQLVKDIQEIFSINWNATGKAIVDGIAAGLNGGKTVMDAIAGTPKDVSDAFTSLNWKSVGNAIGDGIAQGIKDKIPSIKSAAASAANAGMEEAKMTIGAASPSKRAREEVGQAFGEGIALGIQDMIAKIKAMVQEMTSAMHSGSMPAFAGAEVGRSALRPYALPSTVAAQQTAAAVNNNVNLNMGGVNINNGMDWALFEARVRRVVKEAMR